MNLNSVAWFMLCIFTGVLMGAKSKSLKEFFIWLSVWMVLVTFFWVTI